MTKFKKWWRYTVLYWLFGRKRLGKYPDHAPEDCTDDAYCFWHGML